MPLELSFENNIAVVRLGSSDEKAVVLNEQRLLDLDQALDLISSKKEIEGLVILGPTTSSFCAGADVTSIKSIKDVNLAAKLAAKGQKIIDKVEKLNLRSVAAIGGFCVGGGCELALACKYRIAVKGGETRIGLPEVKLGILPGFGGSVRMPRLIGLPAALDIILQGKILPSDRAHRVGLIDQIVAENELESMAKDIASGNKEITSKKLSLKDKFLTFTSLGRKIVKSNVLKKLLKETKGNYPAPIAALNVCVDALSLSVDDGLVLEIKEVSKLIVSNESKSLIHIFQLTEKSKKLGRSAVEQMQGITVGVLGGGVMGAGIAGALLEKGYSVVLCDINVDSQNKARDHIHSYIDSRKFIKDKQAVISKLHISGDLKDFGSCALVIEAIIEKLEVKQSVFKNLSEIVSDNTILASNTSSLSIDLIAESATFPERVVGMHFFNPAEKMPLVEIIRGKKTSDSTIVKIAALTSKLGKFPVVVENVPGFLVNRVLSPYMAEASQLLSEGYSMEDIDNAAMSFGMPMGPIRLLDEVGLDVAKKVQEEMQSAYGSRMSAPRYLDKMISDGRLGKKSNLGFYKYEDKSIVADNHIYELLSLPAERKKSDLNYIAERLIMPLVNESIRCLDESVAGIPGEDAAGQIDLATVMGIGFAPFRGGAIHFAENIGVKKLSIKLKTLSKISEARFAASAGVQKRLEGEKSFYSVAV